MENNRNNKSFFALLIGNLFSLFFFLILAELVIYILVFFNLLSVNLNFTERRSAYIQYQPTAYANAVLKPNQEILLYDSRKGVLTDSLKYKINSWGLREDKDIIKNPNLAIIMGGSYVFDINAVDYSNHKTWVTHANDYINQNDRNIKLLNAGIPGSNLADYPGRIIHQFKFLNPKYIVLISEWNEIRQLALSQSNNYLLQMPKAITKDPVVNKVFWIDEVFYWSGLYRRIRDYYIKNKFPFLKYKGVVENIESDNFDINELIGDKAKKQIELNLRNCINAAKLIGATPILALEDRLATHYLNKAYYNNIRLDFVGLHSVEDLIQVYKAIDEVYKKVALKENVNLIDNSPLSGDETFFKDHVHTSPKGSELIGRYFGKELLKIIEKTDSSYSAQF